MAWNFKSQGSFSCFFFFLFIFKFSVHKKCEIKPVCLSTITLVGFPARTQSGQESSTVRKFWPISLVNQLQAPVWHWMPRQHVSHTVAPTSDTIDVFVHGTKEGFVIRRQSPNVDHSWIPPLQSNVRTTQRSNSGALTCRNHPHITPTFFAKISAKEVVHT